MNNPKYDRRQFLKVAGASAAFGAVVPSGAAQGSSGGPGAMPASSGDLCFMSAKELAALIHMRKLSGARGHERASRSDQSTQFEDQCHRFKTG